jgi:hypothetical protein
MKPWRRRSGGITGKLDRAEKTMLAHLLTQVSEMLAGRAAESPDDELSTMTGISTGPSTAPADPSLARLLPDFHRLDADSVDRADLENSAAALRSLHEPRIVEEKQGNITFVLGMLKESGSEIALSDSQAEAWLAAVNDVRLVLGSRLEVTEDPPERLPRGHSRAGELTLYHWLTFCQDSLVGALSGSARGRWK